ncbi:LegC family aminotransferase [Solitalea sp. MAHUQ-68]|uniref:GDP-perosamine synthase n=1 Tax=Solitalea agri TaxID=2953739 RepID=A0A9X2JCI7_9SPHI|nr:LegC family aminotransferase [Solitalea agri]MCO4293108.1 LegC family aminotransferase [Solitalea agri]
MYKKVVEFIREQFKTDEFIPLHAPVFTGNEKEYLLETIDSTFVSSVGKYVDKFEELIRDYTGAKYAIATTNGTSALHMALMLAGVKQGDLVLTQPLSFIATCNAISYIGAEPLFIDVDKETLSLSADALNEFLKEAVEVKDGQAIHKNTGRRIAACIPMHTFGHPARIDELVDLCQQYNINLIEDAAESLGTTYKNQQTGTFGLLGTYSFNGNKTITCGGGGMIVTNDEHLGKLAKHLTTQAKVPHRWDFVHDHIGYNYRLPNLNAALACAQIEQLDAFIANKRELAENYHNFFAKQDIQFVSEPNDSKSNYWLNAILLKNREERDEFLTYSNENGVMTRPVWELMNRLPMFTKAITTDISNAEWIADRLVNIPSSVRVK